MLYFDLMFLKGNIVNIHDQSPAAIAEELGNRLKQARLNANITQEALAEQAGVSLKVLRGAERGRAQLESFIAVLAALGLTDQLNHFLPHQPISPVQLVRMQGKARRRASSPSAPSSSEEPTEW